MKTFLLPADRIEKICHAGTRIELDHHQGDAAGCLRLFVSSGNMEVVILPTKGLSVGNVSFDGRELFWDAPIGLVNPDSLNLWGDHICRNGKPVPGVAFLETFASGIELYGLKNWGMHRTLPSGELMPLHGETSNIPVKEIEVKVEDDRISVTSAFDYRTFKGGNNLKWYQRGEKLFEVKRTVEMIPEKNHLIVFDNIRNSSSKTLTPDWGYHITMKPEPGSRLIVPGRTQMNRSGKEVPEDIQTWNPARDESIRSEVGIIHQGFDPVQSDLGERIYSELIYPDGTQFRIGVPPAPYFQTWFCSGGANTPEITRKDGTPLYQKNWDGQGIEIGSSGLDHDGNTDPGVESQKALKPGESRVIVMDFKRLLK